MLSSLCHQLCDFFLPVTVSFLSSTFLRHTMLESTEATDLDNLGPLDLTTEEIDFDELEGRKTSFFQRFIRTLTLFLRAIYKFSRR